MSVLVTAAGRGIGHAVAMAMAQAGADVAVTDIRPEVTEVAGQIERLGGRSLPIVADLTRSGSAAQAVAETAQEFGRLDVLCNCAGGMRRVDDLSWYDKPTLELSEDDVDRTFALTVKSSLFAAIAAAPIMAAQGGGSIINTGSNFGRRPGPRRLPYGIAKAGVVTMTQSLAAEWGPLGIRVNEVVPFARTDATRDRMADPIAGAKLLESVALGRFSEPAEIAPAYVFLASSDAAYINGTSIAVDGGRVR